MRGGGRERSGRDAEDAPNELDHPLPQRGQERDRPRAVRVREGWGREGWGREAYPRFAARAIVGFAREVFRIATSEELRLQVLELRSRVAQLLSTICELAVGLRTRPLRGVDRLLKRLATLGNG